MENEEHFEKPKKNKDVVLIKKIAIVCGSIAVALIVIVSNCNKDKKKESVIKNTESSTIVSNDTVIDTYEKEFVNDIGDTNTFKKISSSSQSSDEGSSGSNVPIVNNITYTSQPSSQIAYQSSPYQSAVYGNPVREKQPYKYEPDNDMKRRLDPDYQNIVNHFKGTLKAASWEIENYDKVVDNTNDKFSSVEEPLKNLYDGADKVSTANISRLPAGTRIIAVTDQDVCSDHPGIFTATVVRPFEVKGSKLVCQSSTNVRDRINVTVSKIISPSNSESSLEGQIQMDYPGLKGDVKRHAWERIGPSIFNAAIGGGFLAWSLIGGDEGRIDTRDAIVSNVVGQSVSGVQNEITRMGGDYPNTITVKKGTQFEILLSAEAVIK